MRLLVVEDNARMASLLQRGLTEEGYSVDGTGDGLEAMEWASARDYDAVVLDVMLPGADGYEVCAGMRRSGRWAPVLMLTARDEVAARVRGLECGADGYVVKPFAFAELTARLRALIRRGAPERIRTLTNGAVTIDSTARRVWTGDREVVLASTQFDLLELFLSHPGYVFSRSQLLTQVWDVAADPRSNVVDQQVGILRRKMKEHGSWDDLETVRGA